MSYQDPGPPHNVHEWDIPALQTLTVDVRNVAYPFGWSVIPGAGGTVTHRGANADEPEDSDWLEPVDNAEISEATQAAESTPVAWLRWAADGAGAKVAITVAGNPRGTVA